MTAFIDKKYINIICGQLDKFKWCKNNLANCRCPICGDSQKNRTKARFYFYESKNKYFVKCHNCGYSSDMFGFLEKVDVNLKKEYSVELWKEKNGTKERSASSLLGLFALLRGGSFSFFFSTYIFCKRGRGFLPPTRLQPRRSLLLRVSFF